MFVGNSLPSLILAVCVHSDAFGGRMSMNPYNFQHFDMDRVWLALNAESIPAEHYELDLDPGAGKNPHANKMFMDLYDTWLRVRSPGLFMRYARINSYNCCSTLVTTGAR